MAEIVAVREAEQWTATNILGGVLLAVVAVVLIVWAIRRYLSD